MGDLLRVMVVEDEALIAMGVIMELERLGVEPVGPFYSLESAQRALPDERVDLAFLDINLGDAKVWPLADNLHRSGCPIVFVSAEFDPAYIADNYPGARAYSKPMPFDLIEQIVDPMRPGRQA